MKTNQTTCDPRRIELFLQQKLSDAEQTSFELHLDDCHACRRQLETTAAGDDAWSAVRDSLRDPPMLPSPSGRGVGGEGEPAADDSAFDSAGEEPSSSQATILKLLAPTDDDRMIGRWGTYEVVGVVGTGGMGVVLKAFDAALNRYVAIKILAPHLGTSGAAIRRFSREGKAAAAVVHDNVIEIYHVAEAVGLPYLVMPYVRGPSLQRRLNDEGPLAVVEILRVAMQAAAGLAAAHAQGLVHRDVKPANILLADGIERVKLTDFGLARAADDASLTRTGVIAGTPQYMSPEQARGEPVDPRSDLFSLGSVLYAMCTGRPPFRAETSYGVLRRITDEEPRPIREINPDIPDWLCGIVGKLMAKRPDDRFQSAREVAALLEQCLAHVQQPTVIPLPPISPLLPGEGQGVRATDSRPPLGEGQGVRAAISSRKSLLKGTLAMLTLLGISLFAAGVVSTSPPDISGNWQGDEWGQVTLTQTAPGEYTGTYTDTVAKEKGPGKIDLKWSRIERRFNGAWREGEDDRFGDLSVRLVEKEIRGALTTDAMSKINPATPRLGDLVWTRMATKTGANAPHARAVQFDDGHSRAAVSAEDRRLLSAEFDRWLKGEHRGAWPTYRPGEIAQSKLSVVLSEIKVAPSIVTAYSNLAKKDVAVRVLSVKIENRSSAPIRTKLAHEWFGGEWPPTDLYASVLRPARPGKKTDTDFKPVFLAGEHLEHSGEPKETNRPVTIAPGESLSLFLRLDWPGTGSQPDGSIVLADRPGAYKLMLLLVFEAEGKRQYVESESIVVNYGGVGNWSTEKRRVPATPASDVEGKADAPHLRAVQFDGNHYSKLEPPPKFTSDDFTISLWCKPTPSGKSKMLFHRGFSYRDQPGDIDMRLNVYSGELDFQARTADNEWLFDWDIPESRLHSPVRYNQWNHVVATRRGDTYTMWVNGARVASEKSSAVISDANDTNPFLVGGIMADDGVRDMFHGALDDFRIFRRCLSDKEIGELYKSNADETFLQGEGRVKLGPLVAAGGKEETPNRAESPLAKEKVAALRAAIEKAATFSPEGIARYDERHAQVVDISANRGGPWSAKLPDGVTVELAGAGGQHRWWRPDGSPTEKSLHLQEYGSATLPDNHVFRAVLLRVNNPSSESVGITYAVTSLYNLGGQVQLIAHQAKPRCVSDVAFTTIGPNEQRTVSVRVGVGCGAWEEIAAREYEDGQERRGHSNSSGRFTHAVEAKDGIVVTSSDRMPASEVRVVAVQADGKQVEAKLELESWLDGRQITATLPGVRLGQLRKIALQHRPYKWIEFRNVVVQAADKAANVPGTVPPATIPAPDGKSRGAAEALPKPREGAKPRFRLNHDLRVDLVAFSPDGAILASSDNLGNIKLTEVSTGKVLQAGHVPNSLIPYSMAFFPKWANMVALGCNDGSAVLLRTKDLAAWKTFPVTRWSIYALAVSANGATVACDASDGTVDCWDVMAGRRTQTLGAKGDRMSGMAFSPDNKLLITVDRKGLCKAWDLASEKELGSFQGIYTDTVSIRFCPDGKTAAVAFYGTEPLRLWDPRGGKPPVLISLPDAIQPHFDSTAPYSGPVKGPARTVLSADCKTAASVLFSGVVAVWDIPSRRVFQVLPTAPREGFPPAINGLAFSPDGRLLAIGNTKGVVEVWDIDAAARDAKKRDAPAVAPPEFLKTTTKETVAATASPARATGTPEQAEADAKRDLQRGSPKYYRVGKPIRHSGQWKTILNRDYSIELVDLGCIGSEYADKYNAVALRDLAKKHGPDFLAKSEAEAIREEEKSRTNTNKPTDKSTIIAALKRRQAHFHAGDITWSEERTKIRWNGQGKNGEMESGVHDGVIHIDHERFAFDGEKKMYYETADANYGCNGPRHAWDTYTSTFNGREPRFYWPPGNPLLGHAEGTISGPQEQWGDLKTLGFRPIILACRPLHPQVCDLDSDDFVLDPAEAMIDGHRCAMLRSVPDADGQVETYWLDRDRDWGIVKYESTYRIARHSHSRTVGRTTIANVQYQNDALHGWVPSAWRTEWRNPDTSAICDVKEAKVVKYAFNEAIPFELFDLPFPPGTFVRDNTKGNPCVYWVAMPGGRKHVLTEAERKKNTSYEELLKADPPKAAAPQ